MKKFHLNDFTKGWFVGDFVPTIHRTEEFEVSYKEYTQGEVEEKHMHKIATEITLIVEGIVLMNGVEYKKGDIIVMEPGEATNFKALTNAKNVVVKIPSAKGDKYFC